MSSEEAENCKAKGNEAFKAGKWDEAIKQYNKAIACDPENPTYYSNRSAAWSSSGNQKSALSDAERCIEKDPNFVKGYSRKGKALFDLQRWDEAEKAYKEGLKVDPANEQLQKGITDIMSAYKRKKAASGGGAFGGLGKMFAGMMGGAGGGGGGGGAAGSFGAKLLEKMKSGGRIQTYILMAAGYYLFTNVWGGGRGKSSSKSNHDVIDDDDDSPFRRSFAEVDGLWLSYLQTERKGSDSTMLLLLHSTSLSAEADYATVLPKLKNQQLFGPLRLLAPDRPCHGYSPCPAGAEPADGSAWLDSLLSARPPPKRLVIAANGREAAAQALALAKRRPETAQVMLLNARKTAPARPKMAQASDAASYLRDQKASAQAAADSLRWAAAVAANAAPDDDAPDEIKGKNLVAKGLPSDCGVTLLYGDEAEDEELRLSLEANGVKVSQASAAQGKTILDVFLEEAQKILGPAEEPAQESEDAPEEEAQEEEPQDTSDVEEEEQ